MLKRIFILCSYIVGVVFHAQSQSDESITIAIKMRSASNAKSTVPTYNIKAIEDKIETKAKPLLKAVKPQSVLSGVFTFTVSSQAQADSIVAALSQKDDIVYAEVLGQEQLLYDPNDPRAGDRDDQQAYLSVIKAYEAWDISKSNDTIIIGISDTGLDFNHDDISPKIYTNPLEKINGLDDDGNGYIDDIHGFDFADNDNDPQCVGNFHGNRVGGIAGAATDNKIGIAGVGFNAMISPLKIFPDNTTSSRNAYTSILYAAQNGYDIINLSWGSTGTYSQFAQNVIDYAVLENDMIVIAAAGNTDAELDFYPASYENVLSVSWTDTDDVKAPNGTYSRYVDLVAPGHQVLSPYNNNTYSKENGSSFATPMVAGAAALAKTIYPHLNARQIMEVLRVSTDDIYSVSGNEQYIGKLGKGRLNIYKALTMDSLRSVRVQNLEIKAPTAAGYFPGDSLSLDVEFLSYLLPLSHGTVSLNSHSQYITINNTPQSLVFTDSMEVKNAQIKNIIINADTPPETTINFTLTVEEGSYQENHYFEITTAPNYYTINDGIFELTIGTNGDIGYQSINDNKGTVLEWNGTRLTNNIGLLTGTNAFNLSDNIIDDFTAFTRDGDFTSVKNLNIDNYRGFQNIINSSFEAKNGLFINQKIVPSQSPDEQFIIYQYQISNPSDSTIKNLKFGYYADWNLGSNSNQNTSYTDQNMMIAKGNDGFAALTNLSENHSTQYVNIDLASENGNSPDARFPLSDIQKYNLLESGSIATAGSEGSGNNIAQLLVFNIDSLPAKSSTTVAIATLAGITEAIINEEKKAAQVRYQQLLAKPKITQTILSCNGDPTTLIPYEGTNFNFFLDPFGQNLIGTGTSYTTGHINGDSLIYYHLTQDDYATSAISAVRVRITEEFANFIIPNDTIYTDEESNHVTFIDQTNNANAWLWQFGNQERSTLASPTTSFSEAGVYDIQLTINTINGCSNSTSQKLYVFDRPAETSLTDFVICGNEIEGLRDPSGSDIAVYTTADDTTPVYIGASFNAEKIYGDTTFYFARIENKLESLKKPINVSLEIPDFDFNYRPDLSSSDNEIILESNIDQPESYSFEWSQRAVILSNEPTLQISPTDSQLNITLTISKDDCSIFKTKQFKLATSAKPTLSFSQPCRGTDLVLKPQNGTYFGFYNDEALSILIQKGESLTIENISENQTIYIVGLDSLLPSEPISAEIHPILFETMIISPADTLNLFWSNSMDFSLSNENEISSVQWYINDVPQSQSRTPKFSFISTGNYQISSISQNTEGCSSYDTIRIEVINIDDSPLNIQEEIITFYPNPASSEINVIHSGENLHFTILDPSGKTVDLGEINEKQKIIPVNQLQAGIYFISFKSNAGSIRTQKLIIK